MRILFIILSLMTYLFIPCYAWNTVGHMLIAEIAYEKLNPSVKEKVNNLVATLGKEYPYITRFEQMAPWPDTLRYQKIETYSHWHYIDNAFSNDGTPLKNLTDTDNVVWAINLIEPVLANAKANPFERARFLAFLVHFVGDIHQPLHTVSRISKAHPDGDQGGNLFFIQSPNNSRQTNLHSLWDSGLGVFELSSPNDLSALVQTITAMYPEKYFGNQINDLDPEDWSKEGSELAMNVVYKTVENRVPNVSYIESGKQLAEQRIALAGYRLARVLNRLLV